MKIIMLGESLERQGGIVSVEKLILSETPSSISFKHIATLPAGSSVKKIWVFAQALGLLLWQLTQQETDVVHIHVSEKGSAYRQMITALIAQAFRQPVIMHTHSCNFHEFYSSIPLVIQRSISWVFRRCTRVIVLSKSWKTFYVKYLNLDADRVIVLSNPVQIPVQIPDRTSADSINLVFLGRIGERKGSFDLLNAFAQLPTESRQRAILTLAGDGEVERAQDMVKRLNLETNVRVLSWIDEPQRNTLLSRAHIFVLPSYNEGLPMALLEAMSWGLPVITTPVGGIPELITSGGNGFLVSPGNIRQLTETMQALIEDEKLRLKLGQAARLSIVPLDTSKYCDELIDVYKSAIAAAT